MILVVVLYSLLGFTITLSKLLLAHVSPIFLVSARMTIAGILLLAFSFKKYWNQFNPQKADWLLLAQFTLFGIIVPHVSRTWALQHVSTIKTALIYNLAPFFTAIFGYLFYKEKLSFIQSIGLIVGFGGTLPLLLNEKAKASQGLMEHFSFPDLVVVIAIASLSYSFFIMQRLVRDHKYSPFIVNGFTMLAGGFIAFNASYLTEPIWIKGPPMTFAVLLVINIICSNIICANLQGWLLKKYSSTFMAFASFLSPIFAALYSMLLLNEGISINFILSFGLVLSGLAIYFYDELKKRNPPAADTKSTSAPEQTITHIPLEAMHQRENVSDL